VLPACPVTRLLVVLLAVGALAVAASVAWRPASAATFAVEGGNNYFCSGSFEGTVCETDVTAGDTVTWTMVAGTHTVTECNEGFSQCPPAGGWDSGILAVAAPYSQTFASTGTYFYRCELHPGEMLGKILVAAATASPAPVVTTGPTNVPGGSATETPVALPQTGGAPAGGFGVTVYVSVGFALLAVAGLAFTFARRSA
jgi:plastocyanin